MTPVTVVIITRNEAANISSCIQSAKLLTQDIVVVDAESSDDTVNLAIAEGARVFTLTWTTYGAARNYGALQAKHNWILGLDADERISLELVSAIERIPFYDSHIVYRFCRKNYMGNQLIHLGTLGFDHVSRLYHRNSFAWDNSPVHECLVGKGLKRKNISGHIHHYGIKHMEDYRQKAAYYAQLCAEKYFINGKKITRAKLVLSPLFNSLKSYLFLGGFLEGRNGFELAKTIAYYSWLKYYLLHLRNKEALKIQKRFAPLSSIEPTTEPVFSSEI